MICPYSLNIIFTFVSKFFLMVGCVKGFLSSIQMSLISHCNSFCVPLAKVIISDSVTVHSKENSYRT